jgi:hypothetical protein
MVLSGHLMKREAIMHLRVGSGDVGSFRAGRDGGRRSRPAAYGAFAGQATLFIAVLLASLLLAAVQVRFGGTPTDAGEITTM